DEVRLLRPGGGVVVGLVQHAVADHAEVQAHAVAVEERARGVQQEVDRGRPGGARGGVAELGGAADLPVVDPLRPHVAGGEVAVDLLVGDFQQVDAGLPGEVGADDLADPGGQHDLQDVFEGHAVPLAVVGGGEGGGVEDAGGCGVGGGAAGDGDGGGGAGHHQSDEAGVDGVVVRGHQQADHVRRGLGVGVVGEVACGEADAVGLQPLLGEVGAGDADAGLGGAAGGGGDVVGLGPQPRVRGAVEGFAEGGEGAAVDGVREAGGDGELHAAAGDAEGRQVDQPAAPGDVEEVVADLAGRAPAAGRDESLGV